jgi:hypothetical protein
MKVDLTEGDTPRKKTRWRTAIEIAVVSGVITLVLGAAYLFALGSSTLTGWRTAADSLSVILASTTTQRELPPGSRVFFENTEVAALTSEQTVPRQRELGGSLLIVNGNWSDPATSGKAISDSTLVGMMKRDSTTGLVVIKLIPQADQTSEPTIGWLRLRPFQYAYRLYHLPSR